MDFADAPRTPAARPAPADPAARRRRVLEPAEWATAGIPLLRNPRELVNGVYERHAPALATAVVAVLDPDQRVRASASFALGAAEPDGWRFRHALLVRLRRIVPHDLRLRVPVRTAVLVYCRAGDLRWTETDGAWMWGLRDACTLHGLRCGAYLMMNGERWQVLGEERGGRRPGGRPVPGGRTVVAAGGERPRAEAVRRPGGARRSADTGERPRRLADPEAPAGGRGHRSVAASGS
ncbi:hypothetical protein [Streptomyces catenulae]|uniref:HEAT repeat domain-containing protein n=1 Tax=Streptomyces catenulae TaxID=66875 RepID=A0ABV2Z184_9ACTN|nr:hypothetical protein [Streptomyces catenulae]